METIEDNKRLVQDFAGQFEYSRVDTMLSLMSEDVRWWINGDPALFPVTGAITKAEFEHINLDMHASLVAGMKMEIVGMVAEGDYVAAELRAHAVTKDGKVYQNDYHMLFAIKGRQIKAVWEYTDLMAVAEVFPLPPVGTRDVQAALSDENPQTGDDLGAPDAGNLNGPKQLVAEYLSKFGHSDINGALRMMGDDSTWWVNGKPYLFSGSGTNTKAEMAELWPEMFALLDGGLAMNIVRLIAEEDRVVAQVRSHGRTKNGKVYRNGFLILFIVKDGKIASVKEYTDLFHATSVFGSR